MTDPMMASNPNLIKTTAFLLVAFQILVLAPHAWAEPVDAESTEEAPATVDVQSAPLPNAIASGVLLDATTIIGSDATTLRTTGSAHRLEEEDLELFNYDDIHRVLSEVPGVYIREEDGYGLRPNIGFRGADSNRSRKVVLMEDGVLFGPAPYSAPAAYYFPLMSRMSSVEVFKGPAAIQYGPNTIGGAINLQTRAIPYERGGEVDLSYGADQYGRFTLHYGETRGHWGYVFDLAHLRSGGFKDLDGGGDTGFERSEGMLKLHWESDPSAERYQRLTFKFGYSEENSKETYLGLSDGDFAANPYRRYVVSKDDVMDWDRVQFQVSHLMEWNGNFKLNTSAYHHDFSRSWAKVNGFGDGTSFLDVIGHQSLYPYHYDVLSNGRDSGALAPGLLYGDNKREYVSQGLQFDGVYDLNHSIQQSLKFGLRLHRDQIERNHDEGLRHLRSSEMVSVGTPSITRLNEDTTTAHSFYLVDEVTWEDWIVSPGVRVESMEMKSENRLTGSIREREDTVVLFGLGFNRLLSDHWILLGGAHQGYSPVAPGQSDSVEEERSLNYELGFRYEDESLRGEVIAFYNDYSNILGEETLSTGGAVATLGTQHSGGAVDVVGVEFSLSDEISLSEGVMPVKLNYTYTQAEFSNSFVSSHYGHDRGLGVDQVFEGESLPYVPEHILQWALGWEQGPWNLNLNGKIQSKMQEIASAEETDAFWTSDFSGFYAWTDRRTIYLKVDNLFDETYIASRRPYGARPGKSRQWQLGFSLSL